MHAGEFSSGEVVPGTRYRVVGLLGRGGMGLVYDVEHLELGKRFVLKALLSDLAGRDDIVARLRNEQRALGRLQHPNIVAVTDAGVTSTHIPYFVMERLEGETLAARLKKCRRLPVVEAIAIARGVLEGLSAAHEIGVVHRDIKPQNILVASGNRPKILDFGVAKIADSASVITARGVAIGTPRYMSPEQVGGEAVDGRSDLYAVGLLLFEMITGAGPFDDARDSNELLLAHLGKAAPRLGGRATGITRELDALVASMLAKVPRDRPPTARAAAAALVAVLARYGGGSNLDAPTPHSSYSSPTRPLIAPGGSPSGVATRPDGVAARERLANANTASSKGTTQRMPHAATDATTSIDASLSEGTDHDAPRAPGGTLYDPSSRMLTVAQPHAVIPIDAIRTERFEIASLLAATGDEPTHTRIPTATPSDGTPSLAPMRIERLRTRHGKPIVALVAGAAVIACVAGAYLLLRASTASDREAVVEKGSHPAASPEPPRAASVEARVLAPTSMARSTAPASTSVPAASAAKAHGTPEPTRSVGNARSSAEPNDERASAAPEPGRASAGSHAGRSTPSATSLPAGLPGSGL